MKNINIEEVKRYLKRSLKKKVKITTSLIVLFMMSNSIVSMAEWLAIDKGIVGEKGVNKTGYKRGVVALNPKDEKADRPQKEEVEDFSVAIGLGAEAKIASSVAIGVGAKTESVEYYNSDTLDEKLKKNKDSGQSTAIGSNAVAVDQATSVGNDTYAIGRSSIAIGSDDNKEFMEETTAYDFNKYFKKLYDKIGNSDGHKYGAKNGKHTDFGNGKFSYNYSPTLSAGDGGIAIGTRALSYGIGATSIGAMSYALGNYSTAMGAKTRAEGEGAIAIGNSTKVFSNHSVAVGNENQILNEGGTAYGYKAYSAGKNSIAIGTEVYSNTTLVDDTKGIHSNYIGTDNNTLFETTYMTRDIDDVININENKINETDSLNVVKEDKNEVKNIIKGKDDSNNSVVLGTKSMATESNSIALGHGTFSLAKNSMAFGSFSYVKGHNSLGLGVDSKVFSNNSIAIGTRAGVGYDSANSLVMGNFSYSTGENALVFGNKSKVTAKDGLAIGSNSEASLANSTALGVNSKTDYNPAWLAEPGYAPKGEISTLTSKGTGVVSIGTIGRERRLTNLASGYRDTDAVNVSQLRSLEEKLSAVNPDEEDTSRINFLSVDKKNISGEGYAAKEIAMKEVYYKEYVKLKAQALEIEVRKERNNETFKTEYTDKITKRIEALEKKGIKAIEDAKTQNYGKYTDKYIKTKTVDEILKEISDDKDQALAKKQNQILTNEEIAKLKDSNYNNDGAIGADAIALGYGAKAEENQAVAIGKNALAKGLDSIAIGKGTKSNATQSYVFGSESEISKDASQSSAIGYKVSVKSSQAVAMGNDVVIEENSRGAVAIGSDDSSYNEGNNKIGGNYTKTMAKGNAATAIGAHAQATDVAATALGARAFATGKETVAVGANSKASVEGAVAIGSYSLADRTKNTTYYNPKTGNTDGNVADKLATKAALSIGDTKNKVTRQLIGLAAGTSDTDAVNVWQLKQLKEYFDENKNFKLEGDNKEEKTFKLPNKLEIKGNTVKKDDSKPEEWDNTYTVENVQTFVKQDKTGKTSVLIGLRKDPRFDKVTVGGENKTEITDSGIDITKKVSNVDKTVKFGIDDNGNATLTDARNGTASPIVTEKSLGEQKIKYKTTNGNKTTPEKETTLTNGFNFSDGTNTEAVVDDNGVVKFNLKDKLTGITSIEKGTNGAKITLKDDSITVNKKITGLEDGDISDKSTDAVNGKQLNTVKTTADTAKSIADTVSGKITALEGKKLGFTGNSGDKIEKKLGEEIAIKGDDSSITTKAENNAITIEVKDKGITESKLSVELLNKINTGNTVATNTITLSGDNGAGNQPTKTDSVALNKTGGINFSITGEDGLIKTTASGTNVKIGMTADLKNKINKLNNLETTYATKTDLENKANKTLDNITDAGKKVIKGLVNVSKNTVPTTDENILEIDGGNETDEQAKDYKLTVKKSKIAEIAKEETKKFVSDSVSVSSTDGAITVATDKTGGKVNYKLTLNKDKIKELSGTTNLEKDYAKVDASNLGEANETTNRDKWINKLGVTKINKDTNDNSKNGKLTTEKAVVEYVKQEIDNVNKNIGSKTITYKANSDENTKKQTSLTDGFNFSDGTNTKAEVADNGVVKFDLKDKLTGITSIEKGTNGTKITLNENDITVNKKITGLEDGKIETNSKDAINGGQLKTELDKKLDVTKYENDKKTFVTKDEITNKLGNYADKNLSNITAEGNKVIKNIAKDAVEVTSEANSGITVTPTKGTDKTTYKLSLDEAKIKELAGTTNITTEYAKVDGTNLKGLNDTNKKAWATGIGISSISDTTKDQLVTDTAVKNYLTKEIEKVNNNIGNNTIAYKVNSDNNTKKTTTLTTGFDFTSTDLNIKAEENGKVTFNLTDTLKNSLNGKGNDGRDGKNGTAGTHGLTGKDGLNGKDLTTKVNALRNGEAGTVVYTDKDGNRLVKANDGKYYKSSQVEEDGKVKADANGQGIENPELRLVDAKGETTKPITLGNLESALGLKGTNDNKNIINKLVENNGNDKFNEKELNRAVTLKDLQYVAKQGLTFEANYNADGNGGTSSINKMLGETLSITASGAENGKYAGANNENYTGTNLATYVKTDNGQKKIFIGMKETPTFKSINIGSTGFGNHQTDTGKGNITADDNGLKLTHDGASVTIAKDGDKAKLSGLKDADINDNAYGTEGVAATQKEVKEVLTKINANGTEQSKLKNGTLGTVVYTDKDGNKLMKDTDGKFYKAKEDGSKEENATEVASEDVILSTVNSDGKTKEPITLGNVASALGLSKDDKGNKKNEILNKLINKEAKENLKYTEAELNKVVTLRDLQFLASKGITFAGSTGTANKYLGDTITINGSNSTGLTNDNFATKYETKNIAVKVDNKTGNIEVGLAKELSKINSITSEEDPNDKTKTKMTLSKDGATFEVEKNNGTTTEQVGAKTTIGKDGISVTKEGEQNPSVSIKAGDKTTGASIDFATNNDNKGTGSIKGLEDRKASDTTNNYGTGANVGRAATEGAVKEIYDKLSNVEGDIKTLNNKGLKFAGNSGTTNENKLGDTVNIKGEGTVDNNFESAQGNINVVAKDSIVELKLASNLKNMKSFETKKDNDGNSTKLDQKGLTITDKGDNNSGTKDNPKNTVEITKDKIVFKKEYKDGNENKSDNGIVIDNSKGTITGVKDGDTADSVVTKGYVDNKLKSLDESKPFEYYEKNEKAVLGKDGKAYKAGNIVTEDGKVYPKGTQEVEGNYFKESDKVTKQADGKFYKESDIKDKKYDEKEKRWVGKDGKALTNQPTEATPEQPLTGDALTKQEDNPTKLIRGKDGKFYKETDIKDATYDEASKKYKKNGNELTGKEAKDVVIKAQPNSNPMTLTNIGDGRIIANSTDAVNGGQVYEALKGKLNLDGSNLDDKSKEALIKKLSDGANIDTPKNILVTDKQVSDHLTKNYYNKSKIDEKIGDVDKKSTLALEKSELALGGVANAVAMANLVQVNSYSRHRHNLSAAYGYYGGSHALAIGFSGTNEERNFVYKLSGSVNNKGNLAFGVGAGVMLGEEHDTFTSIDNKKIKEVTKKLDEANKKISEYEDDKKQTAKKFKELEEKYENDKKESNKKLQEMERKLEMLMKKFK